MTKFLAVFMSSLLQALTFLLPRWKRLTVQARLHDLMQPVEVVTIDGHDLKLFIPDRTCVYWARNGPGSEPMTNTWVRSFGKGDTFVDIGANIGLYSLLAAAQGVSRVYAFEPNPFSFSVLTRNIIANGFDGVISPLCLAMNEGSSLVTFKLGGLHAGSVENTIIDDASSPESATLTTASFSIDELFRIQGIAGVNHLKIDVDGLELEILRGATGLISNPALKSVLVEDDTMPVKEESALASFLNSYGFHQSDAWGPDDTINKIFVR